MLEGVTTGAAETAGRMVGGWVAGRWGPDIRRLFDEGKRSSGALAGALVDTLVLEGLSGAIWPSVAAVMALLALHAAAAVVAVPEAERILVGLVALATILWSAWGIASAVRFALPHVRLWAVTCLPPVRHARLVLFTEIRERHRRLLADLADGSLGSAALLAAIETVQGRLGLTPERAAYALADHLAPVLIRHLAERLLLLVAPVAAALLYYRLVLYPDVIGRSLGVGPWTVALYPFAALADLALGTGLREGLRSM
ncbi:MAG: hypothetical protein AB7P02_14395 [Alphaproteobacteria bacterium]